MIALCCGSRFWTDREIVAWYLGRLLDPEALVIHGDNGYDIDDRPLLADAPDEEAARGADKICGSLARRFGHHVERFPAEWQTWGLGAGPRRNREMREYLKRTERKERLVIAFHDDPWTSKGTGNMLGLIREENVCAIVTINSKGRMAL